MPYALSIIMGIAIVVLVMVLVYMNRTFGEREAAKDESQAALLKTIEALGQAMEKLHNRPNWSQQFSLLMQESFKAVGTVVYCQDPPPSEDEEGPMRIVAASGDCSDWQRQTTGEGGGEDIPLTFHPGVPEDFFWSRRPLIYDAKDLEGWMPPDAEKNLQHGLVAPLTTDQGPSFLLLVRRGDQEMFTNDDQIRLSHCVSAASAGFQALIAEDRRKQMEMELNYAHEEGMLQISTGIIHNIGNGITVIQIALERLSSGDLKALDQLTKFIDREIMPDLARHLEAGTLQEFLQDDPQGKEYLTSLRLLIEEIPKILDEHKTELDFVVDKFRSVTEIITLQQQFIGELGTENVVAIKSIMDGVMKLCQEPIEQRNIDLKQSLKTDCRILVDPAMLRHMLLLIVKYAIESASSTRRSAPIIWLKTSEGPMPVEDDEEPNEDENWVRILVADNGAGADTPLNEDDILADRQNVDERTRDLFFCKRRVEKYGGRFDLKTEFGRGTKVSIYLPVYDDPEEGEESTESSED